MSFFISDAMAAAPQGQADPLTSFLPLIIIFIVFYFLLIRPQSKKAKEHRQMVGALAKGDEVVTSGGILGRITRVGDSFVDMDAGNGVILKVQRQSIANLMPKGTIKEARD